MPSTATTSAENVFAIFKAYDVRGLVDSQLDVSLARSTGAAFAELIAWPDKPADRERPQIVIGYDMRPSSPSLAEAFAEGATSTGADVVSIGLASTDQLYFASGSLGLPGVMFTASHNPAAYNGMKMCRANAVPVGADTGLHAIRDRIAQQVPPTQAEQPGSVTSHDLLQAYADHLLALAPVAGHKLKIVVDAGNGMAGLTAPVVFGKLADQVAVTELYFELDGTFPNHEANPIDPDNLRDLQAAVVAGGADLGLAFDGDADRCFLVDERGDLISPSALTGLIAQRELTKEPGAAIIHNLITSRAVPELVTRLGGTPVRTRVGHSFIKATMAETGAVFGGEHSGHFYFRDFWRADSGMLAALHALAALAENDQPASVLMGAYEPYVASGEINSEVADQAAIVARIKAEYATRDQVRIDELDGLTVLHPDWWFNVRASNTEPLLRLNAEGRDQQTMISIRDAVLAEIRS